MKTGKVHKVEVAKNAAEAAFFAQKGIPYIVYLNESNRDESFPNGAYCVENLEQMEDDYLERVYRRFKGLPWEIVQTNRLKIREITVEDVLRLYELYEDSSITQYMEPLFSEPSQEKAYTKEYIKNIYGFYGYGMWVMEEKISGKVIGRVGIEYKEGFDGLELGFMLGVDYQHKGYALEACKAVLAYGVKELNQKEYCAFMDAGNTASIKLCERLGFEKRGIVQLDEMKPDGSIRKKEFVQYIYHVC